jgi:hypothetical protein
MTKEISEQGISQIARSENVPTSKDRHTKNLQNSVVTETSHHRHNTPEAMDSSRAKSKPRKGQSRKQKQLNQINSWPCFVYGRL